MYIFTGPVRYRIARKCDEDALGMVLPATAEHLGYTHAKENNQLKVLDPNSKITFTVKMGLLDTKETESVVNVIQEIVK